MEFLKTLRQEREENSKPRLIYHFQSNSLQEASLLIGGIQAAVEKINNNQTAPVISANLGYFDEYPVIIVKLQRDFTENELFEQAITVLFQEAGAPDYLFNCEMNYDVINPILNRRGEALKKDGGWISRNVVYTVSKI